MALKKVDEFVKALGAFPAKYALICRVMIESGFRVSDALNLKKSDIMQASGRVVQITERKTQKRRPLILSEQLHCDLLEYANRENLRRTDFLFPSTAKNRAKHVSRQQVYKVFRKAAVSAGHTGVIAPHSCRKTYAHRKFLEHGDVLALQKDLRHTSVHTTFAYILDAIQGFPRRQNAVASP